MQDRLSNPEQFRAAALLSARASCTRPAAAAAREDSGGGGAAGPWAAGLLRTRRGAQPNAVGPAAPRQPQGMAPPGKRSHVPKILLPRTRARIDCVTAKPDAARGRRVPAPMLLPRAGEHSASALARAFLFVLSVCLSVCLSVRLSVPLSLCPSVSLSLSLSPSLSPSLLLRLQPSPPPLSSPPLPPPPPTPPHPTPPIGPSLR